MAYWFLLKNQTHEAGTMSQWVGALDAPAETWDWFWAPTNICQFQSRRPDATFCPPQTLHAQNVGINTHIRGGGGREGEPRHPYSQNENKCSFWKGFLFGVEKIAAVPPHPSPGSAAGTQQGISCQLPTSLIRILQQGPFPLKAPRVFST